jgi:hypothetical protein
MWSQILIILVLTAFSFSASYAQGLSIWNGKWFKITEKVSLLQTNESGSISPSKYSQRTYMQIYDVDNTNGILQCNSYDYRDGGLISTGPIVMQVLAGSALDFIWWIQLTPEVNKVVTGGAAGRIQGKMKNDVLNGATLKTVGMAASITTDLGPAVGGVSWSGSLVPESKVPPIIQ